VEGALQPVVDAAGDIQDRGGEPEREGMAIHPACRHRGIPRPGPVERGGAAHQNPGQPGPCDAQQVEQRDRGDLPKAEVDDHDVGDPGGPHGVDRPHGADRGPHFEALPLQRLATQGQPRRLVIHEQHVQSVAAAGPAGLHPEHCGSREFVIEMWSISGSLNPW
jgi:hypothetical protein